MITMQHPCTACVIIDGLLKEVLQKVKNQVEGVQTEIIILKHPNELYSIEGVEVERLPIIMLDCEQISAGSFITDRQIISLIKDNFA
jgi:hypothetical protein